MNNGTYANSGNVVLTQENINTESVVKVCENAKVKTTAESIDSYIRVKVSYKPIGTNANNDFVTSVIVALNSDLNNYITTIADTQNSYGWFYNENDEFYYLSTLDSEGNPTQTLKECNSNIEYNILSSVMMPEISKYNLGINVKSIPSNSMALCVDAQAVQKQHLNLSTANNVGELSELISKANKNNSLFNDIITNYGNIVRFNTVSNALKIPTSITTNINAVEFTLPQVDGVDVDWYDSYISGQYGIKIGSSGNTISKATIESKGDMVLYAKYSTDSITFAFESDGADNGVVPANITTTYGDGKTQVVVNTLEKYGYECVSWVVKGDSTKFFPISTTLIEINNNIGAKGSTVTFIPKWQAVTYTATFVMDENSSLDDSFTNLGSNVYSTTYTVQDKFTFPLPTITNGKTFKGFEVVGRVENSRWRVKDIYTNGEMIKGNFGNVTFKIVYEGSGSGSGTTTKTDIATLKETITIEGPTQIVYDGTQKQPNVIVKTSDGKKLTKDGDYELVYGENINAGEGTIIVNGKNGYEGYVELRFTIVKRNITNANVSTLSDKTYTGNEITQNYTVSDVILNETTSLVADVDYQGVFSQNINAGTAKLTIIGLGNYSGTKEVEFKINQLNISGATITLINTSLVYNGELQTFKVSSVVTSGKISVDAFTVTNNAQTNVGNYTLTVTGSGNFIGNATKSFQITQKALTITAKEQTIQKNGSIQNGTSQIDASGLISGHIVTSVTLTQSSTTANGTITPSNATVKHGSTDVTSNYNITYKTGQLIINSGSGSTSTEPIYIELENGKTYNLNVGQKYRFNMRVCNNVLDYGMLGNMVGTPNGGRPLMGREFWLCNLEFNESDEKIGEYTYHYYVPTTAGNYFYFKKGFEQGIVYNGYEVILKSDVLFQVYFKVTGDSLQSGYNITINSNNEEYGTVSKTLFNAPNGASVTSSGNKVTINNTSIYAVANTCADENYEYRFKNWTNASGTISGDRTITANFEKVPVKLNFVDVDGKTRLYNYSEVETGQIFNNNDATKLFDDVYTGSKPDKSGWTFIGWSTKQKSKDVMTSFTMPSGKIDVYPVFKKSCSVSFENLLSGNITMPNSITDKIVYYTAPNYAIGVEVVLPSDKPSKENYIFMGWKKDISSPSYYYDYSVGQKITLTNSLVLYACFVPNWWTISGTAGQNSINIAVTKNNGTITLRGDTVEYKNIDSGIKETITVKPQNGYVFSNWVYNIDRCTITENADGSKTIKIESDGTLVAECPEGEAVIKVQMCTVNSSLGTGNLTVCYSASQIGTSGTTLVIPTGNNKNIELRCMKTVNGKTFKGWYTSPTASSETKLNVSTYEVNSYMYGVLFQAKDVGTGLKVYYALYE